MVVERPGRKYTAMELLNNLKVSGREDSVLGLINDQCRDDIDKRKMIISLLQCISQSPLNTFNFHSFVQAAKERRMISFGIQGSTPLELANNIAEFYKEEMQDDKQIVIDIDGKSGEYREAIRRLAENKTPRKIPGNLWDEYTCVPDEDNTTVFEEPAKEKGA